MLETLEARALPSLGVSVLVDTGPGTPYALAAGDFNHDGLPDLATGMTQAGVGVIAVTLNNGTGKFGPPTNFSAGLGSPRCVTVADFNGDGNPDLAVGSDNGDVFVLRGKGDVFVLRGKGDGTLLPPTSALVSILGVNAVAVADFNGDGKLDLLTSEGVLAYGNGDGTFGLPQHLAVGSTPWAGMAVADFNGDGRPDLALANPGRLGLIIALNQGNGSFQQLGDPNGVTLAIPGPAVLAGDFNGDGKADLAVASDYPSSQPVPGSLVVLLGKGDGTFTPPVAYAAGFLPFRVAGGDFNGDGKPDLVVANYGDPINGMTPPTLQEFDGTGDGTFTARPAVNMSVGLGGGPVAADFNVDGKTEAAVTTNQGVLALPATALPPGGHLVATGAGAGGGPQVNVYDADSGYREWSFMAYDPAFRGGVRVAVGDVNADGVPDIITAPGPSGGPDVRVWDGVTGKLAWEFMAFDPAFLGGAYVAAGNLPNDGAPPPPPHGPPHFYADVVVGAGEGGGPHVKAFSGATHQPFASFYAYDPAFRGGVRVAVGDVNGDVNGDSFRDLVTGAGPGGEPQVKVFDGTTLGAATPTVLQSYDAFDPSFTGGVYVAAGDTNNDGRADVIAGAGAGTTPQVKVFSGANGAVLQSFLAYGSGFRGGVTVGAVAIPELGDGGDVITGPGPGGGPHVKVLRGQTPDVLDSFYAYDPAFRGGVFVGGA